MIFSNVVLVNCVGEMYIQSVVLQQVKGYFQFYGAVEEWNDEDKWSPPIDSKEFNVILVRAQTENGKSNANPLFFISLV